MQSVMILGRQPALGLAELESLYGAGKVQPIGEQAALVDVDPCLLAFDRLGGSVKFCKLLTILDTTNWGQIEKFLLKVSPGHSQMMPEGKMQLGLSLYGFNESLKRVEATGLTLKKAIRKTGRNVRLIPNKSPDLNTAQVLHNHLTGPTGWELVFIKDGNKTVVAQTVKVQDIESYTKRDRGRPRRDARVGMLPPKLAQSIINLAAGKLPEDELSSICDIPANEEIPPHDMGQKILDPFCGTGVIMQEAYLMGYGVYGTDLEQRMADYTLENMRWLATEFNPGGQTSRFETADATHYKWPHEFDFVASEVYLGRPFTPPPDAEILAKTVSECNLIIKRFLQNIHGQLPPGTRLCLAVPAWRPANQVRTNKLSSRAKPRDLSRSLPQRRLGVEMTGWKFLPLVDQIEDLGYNRISFEHAGNEDLIYFRDDQIVARQLIVITRK